MRIYAISLARSPQRRAHIKAELDRIGRDYEIVDGVDGSLLTAEDRLGLVDEEAVAASPEWLTPGQIGCSLSHHRVYELMLERDDPIALVLEDDAVLSPGLGELLDAIADVVADGHIALLYYRSFQPVRLSAQGALALPGEHRLLRPLQVGQPMAATAYVLTRATAARLIPHTVPVARGADSWGDYFELGALDGLQCVYPRPVGTRLSFPSTIDYLPEGSRAARVKALATSRAGAPLRPALTAVRWARDRRMTRVSIN